MARPGRVTIVVEEYFERRTLSAAGQTVERRYRRARWEPGEGPDRPRRVTESAGTPGRGAGSAAPLLRALVVALAPAIGRLALRALAPRLIGGPRVARPLRPPGRGAERAPLALPPGEPRADAGREARAPGA